MHPDPQTPENEPPTPLSDDDDISSTSANDDVTTPHTETQERVEAELPRLTIAGKLGRLPHFRETPNDTLIARLPVAVHEKDSSTSWHTALSPRERAGRLRIRALQTSQLLTQHMPVVTLSKIPMLLAGS
ncbi:hypothetical protein BH23CHL2_BH23CHL2_19780 [soil metagenome]